MSLVIRTEKPVDREAIQRVNRLAFGRDDEARLVDALRDEGYVRLSLVAELGGVVVGHILFSDLPIVGETATVSAVALAPVAVAPTYQRQQIGSELIRRGLANCRDAGQRIAIVLGHPDFYRGFGFSAELARPLDSPFAGNPAFMALELVPGALDGVRGRVEYPPPFNGL
jgi:putative acetyltransferase